MSFPDSPDQDDDDVLHQVHPDEESKFPGYRSKTESKASYRLDALHEYGALKNNGTIPNHIVLVNYLVKYSKDEIQALWRKHSRRLRLAGIVARAAIEITKDEWRQRPVSRVHYHFVFKNDRTRNELKELFEKLYLRGMSKDSFKVHVFPFDEKKGGWLGYIAYFVKLKDSENNFLFKRGLWLRKYYTIGQWWTYPDGTPRTRQSIEDGIRHYAITQRLKKSEKYITHNYFDGEYNEESADQTRLKKVLDKETDETLYDWYSISMEKPTLFQTVPPDWFIEKLPRYSIKWIELMGAILKRLRYSTNPDIAFALEIYHNITDLDKYHS